MTGPIAYLTGQYPRATDTFIQREVAALRAMGMTVETATIRQTDPEHHVGAEQRAEFVATFPVMKTASRPWRLVRAHAELLLSRPLAWFGALGLAWRTAPPGLRAGLWQMFYFLEAGVLATHLRRQGVVHLHNHFADSSCSVAMLTSAMSGIPFSLTMHGPAIFFEPKHWRIDEKIARAVFVACISHFCRSQAMLFSDRAHWHKLKIVHCGVAPELYAGPTERVSGKQMLFVGRLDAVKGVPLLLDTLAALRTAHPDMRLGIIGDGPDREELVTQARELGLADIVEFMGYRSQPEVAVALQTADLLVLPSFAEGLPVVLMEAMAARRPVIASQVGGVSELVENGVNGFLVPAGDTAELRERINQLLSDPVLRARMGEEGRNKVVAEFDAMAEAAWLCNLFSLSSEGKLPSGLRPAD